MYYLYLGKKNDFQNPEKIIIEYEGQYFFRESHTEWSEMKKEDITIMLEGSDNRYYSIEKDQFEKILDKFGGSRYGYKSKNIHNLTDNLGYGESYDEEE